MSIQFWIIVICALSLYNIYYETNIFKYFQNYKKFYKMGIVLVFGLGAMKILNSSSKMSYENMQTLNQFIKILPMDKNSKDMLTPFLSNHDVNTPMRSVQTLQHSGKKSNKRCVSETKKKYVASLQNWKCNKCHDQLSAWYEVDHKIRLEYGGTNELDNLEALCRECHGRKTAMENL
jgi:hypothetical protein